MNPWLATGLAAAALFLVRMGRNAQQQQDAAQAGTQAGAGQTSDQGGGGSFVPFGTQPGSAPSQGGVTQPVSTVSYQPAAGEVSSSPNPVLASPITMQASGGNGYYFAPPPGSSGASPSYASTPTAGGGYINPAYNRLPGSPVQALIGNPYNDQFTSPQSANQPTRPGVQL